MREFLSKLEELMGKVSYENDPVKAQKPALQKKADKLLRDLLKRSQFKHTVSQTHNVPLQFPKHFLVIFFEVPLWLRISHRCLRGNSS